VARSSHPILRGDSYASENLGRRRRTSCGHTTAGHHHEIVRYGRRQANSHRPIRGAANRHSDGRSHLSRQIAGEVRRVPAAGGRKRRCVSVSVSSPAKAPLSRAFRHQVFAVLWTATVVSNTGNWMYGAAAAWLMTSLSRDTLLVSLVQVAASLPLFVFAIPAGALADVFDRRRFLLGCQAAGTVLCAAFAIMVAMQRVTPVFLLIFVTLIGVTTALMYPVWQSIVPTLVPRSDLDGAIAATAPE
jgi:Transmembrane secretion effector